MLWSRRFRPGASDRRTPGRFGETKGPRAMSMTDKAKKFRDSEWADTARTVAYAVLIALVIRALLFQPFNIPSGSMIPTLLIGDYLFVSKYSYGYSKHSLPFSLPLFEGRVLGSQPERGDVIVFKKPTDNQTDFIKRLIGLPGDQIQMRRGVLHINGQPVQRERIEDFIETRPGGSIRRYPQYRETLPNGVSYVTLDTDPDGYLDNTGVYKVPAGHFFMMGDNRDNSNDSRVPAEVGYVPFENLVGRAEVLFFSTDGSARIWEPWKWFSATRWDRIFSGIN